MLNSREWWNHESTSERASPDQTFKSKRCGPSRASLWVWSGLSWPKQEAHALHFKRPRVRKQNPSTIVFFILLVKLKSTVRCYLYHYPKNTKLSFNTFLWKKCTSGSNSKGEEHPRILSLVMPASMISTSEVRDSAGEARRKLIGTGNLCCSISLFLCLYFPSPSTLQTYQTIYRSHIIPIPSPTVCHFMLFASPLATTSSSSLGLPFPSPAKSSGSTNAARTHGLPSVVLPHTGL